MELTLSEKINSMKKLYTQLKIEENANGIIIQYKDEVYEETIKNEQDLASIQKLLDFLNAIAEASNEITIIINDPSDILLESKLWEYNEFSIGLDFFNKEMILTTIDICKYIKNKDEKIKIGFYYDYYFISLSKEEWKRDLTFGGEIHRYDHNQIITIYEDIKKFFEYKYIDRSCCYYENYIEYPITTAHYIHYYFGSYDEFFTAPDKMLEGAINFDISNVSEYFWNHSLKDQRAVDITYDEIYIPTLKIYNLNDLLSLDINSDNFLEKSYETALNILFKLSHENSIELSITDIPDYDDESFIDEIEKENFDEIEEHTLLKLYDNDLINYYYRAINMEDSEFKYLAFYQILECIFDEVHLHATVQDVKHIINSDWFSKHSNEDIKEVIKVVETYNKKRNDREKLILVLENYFKGSAHEKAFFIANRNIINILKEMKVINKEEELKDLQKLVNVIYDFRCKCTHSNRTFPFRSVFEDNNEELSNYIVLIKKIAEKVIINYEKK